jgi:hypothetical protein
MRGGYLQFGRFRGAPIRFHVTIPVGALLFTGLSLQPGAWVAFVVLILVHELGHALLCRAYRLRVVEIRIHGLGGECHYRDTATPWQRSVVAWGGVLAQALLLAVTFVVDALGLVPPSGFGYDVVTTFVLTNLCMIALNLLPVDPLDGADAWMLFAMLPARLRGSRRRAHARRRLLPRRAPGRLMALPKDAEEELRRIVERARKRD